MIEVQREPAEFGPPFEPCAICSKETPYWFVEKDVPICPTCAISLDAEDVPSKEAWIKMTEISAKVLEFRKVKQ